MGFRVRLGKNLSYGKTGLRVNGKVGGVRVSAGKSGTYLGAGAGPLTYNTKLKTGGKRARPQVAGRPGLTRGMVSGAATTSAPLRQKVYIRSIPRWAYVCLTILAMGVVGAIPLVGPLLGIVVLSGAVLWALKEKPRSGKTAGS